MTMKPFAVSLAALIILLAIPFNVSADFNKTKIAVLDFQLQGDSFKNQDLGAIVAEWFITAMVRQGRFDVVERRLLKKILSEQQLAISGVIDQSSATELGRLLGVKVIISGSVMNFRDMIEINARIIDVESASIIAAESVRSSRASRLQDLVVDMSGKIMKNFPLEGYIVNRSAKDVTLDLGLRTGIKTGMKFTVFKEGQVIKHPKTGEVLEVERIKTGTISITEVRKKICKANIDEENSPGSIDYGQMVKSLRENSSQKAHLYVNAIPETSRIRIINIGPRYERGMILAPGPYHIEVSAAGYETQQDWINIDPGKQKNISFTLVAATTEHKAAAATTDYTLQAPPIVDTTAPALSSQNKGHIRMLKSNNLRSVKDTARKITKAGLSNRAVLDVVEEKLLSGYRTDSRHNVDTMAWLCKALGASGVSKYRSTLRKVTDTTPSRKLRKYCQQSLNRL